MNQIIFFSIVFLVYGLINFYIGNRASSVIPHHYKTAFLIVFVFIVIAYIAGRIIEKFFPSLISESLIWIGSFWIAFMFYFFLFIILIDLLRLASYLFNFSPNFISENIDKTKRIIAILVVTVTAVLVIAGHVNIYKPHLKTIKLNIDKRVEGMTDLNLVLISDIHLGNIIGNTYLSKVVNIINNLKPDIILLAGDIVDEDIESVIRKDIGKTLKQLKAVYGVYGITGNHEYIGGVEPACEYLTNHNINMLRDSSILIDNNFYLIGREDRAISQFAGKKRKPLDILMKGIDKSLPVILMDHQPFGLEDAAESQIDLQLSGHTHNGQLWPLNFLIDKIYDIGWGYKQVDATHYYVSCGVGGWGPPVRTGSSPEIVNILLNFNEK